MTTSVHPVDERLPAGKLAATLHMTGTRPYPLTGAATLATHASMLWSRNLTNFVLNFWKDKEKALAAKFSAAKFYQYEALTGEASAVALGDGVKLVADFSKADRIVSLDCDFAGTDSQGPVRSASDSTRAAS